MRNINFIRPKYSLKELIEFESDPIQRKEKTKTTIILLAGFILYSIIASIPAALAQYKHGLVTNISIAFLFLGLGIVLYKTQRHIIITIVGSYMLSILLFIHLIMETDWNIGMDAFWLFILIMPFITDYLAGVFFGTISSLSGLVLSLLLFKTPLILYLQPYGKNMIDWFSIIYVVVMAAAAVMEYELTMFQMHKKASDKEISYYQNARSKRLKEQLSIYESNELIIRKYKHDIRHYNRVLAGLISDGKYQDALSYLKDFDSKLELVSVVSYCDNQIVNEFLTIYGARCQKLGFKLRAKAIVPERLPVESTDLTSLVANTLENALEAQERIPDPSKRSIQFELTYDGRKLKLLCKNPCIIDTKFDESGLPISTRAVPSGIGTAQIKNVAEKYCGVASFIQDNDSFIVKAVMTVM
ncbi:GHKL domain-containing protein [Butyrivibrio proteoclasticus]|uniref:GHKL domain-containing protein n=1 Tax=Butyrivibrio proteoclasticus TaxID=43305 RepID=A0A1I5PPW3_9FIRM|nr:GHKL domain-containing protein [Butyrivibrio proteoclasticus]SFP35561.1 GHKL domain-containing protein [Butyrivibrio proteoclasticus]